MSALRRPASIPDYTGIEFSTPSTPGRSGRLRRSRSVDGEMSGRSRGQSQVSTPVARSSTPCTVYWRSLTHLIERSAYWPTHLQLHFNFVLITIYHFSSIYTNILTIKCVRVHEQYRIYCATSFEGDFRSLTQRDTGVTRRGFPALWISESAK